MSPVKSLLKVKLLIIIPPAVKFNDRPLSAFARMHPIACSPETREMAVNSISMYLGQWDVSLDPF